MYDYIITKPSLDEDTLAHYGVKGMKWGKRKSRKRNITGKGKGGFKSGPGLGILESIMPSLKIKKWADQLNNARTNEERAALYNAIINRGLKDSGLSDYGYQLKKSRYGTNTLTDGSNYKSITQREIEADRKGIQEKANKVSKNDKDTFEFFGNPKRKLKKKK